MSGNQLSGSISSITGLTSLTSLDLSGNQLSGSISSITGLTALTSLDLSGNRLSGAIPGLSSLTALRRLHLQNNRLTGSVPSLATLTHLDLSGNRLSGAIPTGIGTWSNLQELKLSGAGLTGTIPAGITGLTSLTALELSDNGLTGFIPTTIGSLTGLLTLRLSGNRLTGSIPSGISSLTSLTALELNDNQLDGPIPAGIGDLADLARLSLHNNDLTGEIPVRLGGISGLSVLSLSGNQLTGIIPSTLGNLSRLESLDLHDNRLTGSIPISLGRLTNLQRLHLDDNQLTGNIPSSLGGLAFSPYSTGGSLRWFSFCGNDLTGLLPSSLLSDWVRLEDSAADAGFFYGPISSRLRSVADCRRAVQLSIDTESAAENDSDPVITVTATLIGYGGDGQPALPTSATTVTVTPTGGSAVAPGDYAAVDPFEIVIPAGQSSASADFTLDLADDSVAEADETLRITGSAEAAVVGTDFIITDDDRSTTATTVALTVSPATVTEGSTTTITVTAAFPADEGLPSSVTTITLALTDGTAAAGTDFTNVTGQTITIQQGSRTGSVSFDLTTTGNTTVAADKNFTITGTSSTLTISPATVTIANDDTYAPLNPSICDSATVVPANDPNLTRDCRALVALRNHWTGNLANAGRLTAGDLLLDWSASQPITTQWSGVTVAGQRITALRLSTGNIAGTIPSNIISQLSGLTNLILDGNRLTGGIPTTLPTSLVHLQLNNNNLTGPIPTTIGNLTQLQYLDIRNNRLTGRIPDELTNTALDDGTSTNRLRICENGFFGRLPASLRLGAQFFGFAQSIAGARMATQINQDVSHASCLDENDAVRLSVDPSTASEGTDMVTVTAQLGEGNVAPTGGLVVRVTTGTSASTPATSGTDFTPAAVDLVIPAGASRASARMNLSIMDDLVQESQERISIVGTSDNHAVIGSTVRIPANDQNVATTLDWSLDKYQITEGETNTTHTFNLTVSIPDDQQPFAQSERIVPKIGSHPTLEPVNGSATFGSSATPNADFTATFSPLTLPAGERSVTGQFTIDVHADNRAEGNETIAIHTRVLVTGDIQDGEINGGPLWIILADSPADSVVSLAVNPSTAAEQAGAHSVGVTASLPSGVTAGRELTIPLTVSPGTARAADFTAATPGTVTIASGASSGTRSFNLTAVVDSEQFEPDETVIVSGSETGFVSWTNLDSTLWTPVRSPAVQLQNTPRAMMVSGYTSEFTVNPASITIPAYDKIISVGLTAGSEEENNGVPNVVVGPARTEDGSSVTPAVTVMTTSRIGSRTRTSNFTIASGSSNSGSATDSFPFRLMTSPIVNDQVVNTITTGRTVSLTGTATGGGGGYVVRPVTATIGDDEWSRRPTGIALTVDEDMVDENAGIPTTVTVTASLVRGDGSTPAGLDVGVDVPVEVRSGTASAGSDFRVVDASGDPASSSFTISIPSGDTSATATVRIEPLRDKVVEGNESLWVRAVSTPGPFGIFEFQDDIDPVAITITDHSPIFLTISRGSIDEGSGPQTITVSAFLPAGTPVLDRDVEVRNLRLISESATSADYKMTSAPLTLTIPAGQRTSAGQPMIVEAVDDNMSEGPESLRFAAAVSSGYRLGDFFLNINDDDGDPPTGVQLTFSPVSEADAPQRVTATAQLGEWTPAATTHTYLDQYTPRPATCLGPDEFGVVRCSYTLGGDRMEVINRPVFSPSTTGLPNDVAVRVELTAAAAGGGWVPATAGPDFTMPTPFAITIPAGQTEASVEFLLDVKNDGLTEPPEAIKADGTAPKADGTEPAPPTNPPDPTNVRLTLIDAPIVIEVNQGSPFTLSADPVTVSEAAGTATVRVTASVDQVKQEGYQVVRSDLTGPNCLNPNSEHSVYRYVRYAPGPNGEFEEPNDPNSDDLFRCVELLTRQVTVPGVAPAVDVPIRVSVGGLTDDTDLAACSVEGQNQPTFCSAAWISDTAIEGVDYVAAPDFTFTFPAGERTASATFRLPLINDRLLEGDEFLTIAGSDPQAGSSPGYVPRSFVNETLTITDADSVAVDLKVDAASVAEDSGTTTVGVTVSLVGGTVLPESIGVVVRVSGADGQMCDDDEDAGRPHCPSQAGKALAGSDYANVSDFTVTIPAGENSATGSFDLAVTDDRLVEGAERVTVSADFRDQVATSQLTINDNDDPPTDLVLRLTPALLTTAGVEVPAPEGLNPDPQDMNAQLPRTYLVTAAPPADQGLLTSTATVTLSVAGGTASADDFGVTYAPDNILQVPAYTTELGVAHQRLVAITVTSDTLREGPESLIISGTATGGLRVAPVTMTIVDDPRSRMDSVHIALDRSEVGEGDGTVPVIVTAQLYCSTPGPCPALEEDRTVELGSSDLSRAVEGVDFTLEDATVTIPAGKHVGKATVQLRVLDDRLVEGDEAVTITGSRFGYRVGKATLLIVDDEQASGELDLRFSRGSVSEADGRVPLVITAGWPAGLSMTSDTEVTVTLGRGSAAAGIDYELLERERLTLTIPAGRSSASVKAGELRLVDDQVAEEAETFEAFGTAKAVGDGDPVRYKVNSAVLSITDDDPVGVELTLNQDFVWEGPDGGEVKLSSNIHRYIMSNVWILGGAGSLEQTFCSVVGVDDDNAPVFNEFCLNDLYKQEALQRLDVITVTASLAGAEGATGVRDRDTVVRVAVGDESDTATAEEDYVAFGGGLQADGFLYVVIPAGESSATASFRIWVADDNVAGETEWSVTDVLPDGRQVLNISPTESLSITGAVTKGGGTDSSVDVTGTELEIIDLNDRTPTTLDFAVSPLRVVEGDVGYTARVTVTATLGSPSPISFIPNPRDEEDPLSTLRIETVLAADLTVPVVLSANVDEDGNVLPGWASSGADYGTPVQVSPQPAVGQSGVTVVIPAGERSGTTVFDLPIVGDTVTESHILFGPSGNEWLRVGADLEGWTTDGAILEITDDDPAPVLQLELDKTSLGEDSGEQTVQVTAKLVAPDGSAGSFPEDIPLVLQVPNYFQGDVPATGSSGGCQRGGDNVQIRCVEETRLSTTGLASAFHDFRIEPPQLEDDEPVSTQGTGVNVQASGPELTEGSEVDVQLALTFPGGTGGAGTNVTVWVGAAGDSAGSADYELVSATFRQNELTITNGQFVVNAPSGAIGVTGTLRLRVTDDALHEGAEVITISTQQGCTPPGCWGGSTQLVIPANDVPRAERKSVTIPAGSSNVTAVFNVLEVLEDNLDEGEGEDIVFETLVGAALRGSAPVAKLRIVDNDAVSDVITLLTYTSSSGVGGAPGVVSESDGSSQVLHVAVGFPQGSGARLVDTVVTLSTENGSAGSSDYRLTFVDPDGTGPLTAGQVVIPAGDLSVLARLGPTVADDPDTMEVDEAQRATADFDVNQDGVAEGDETFFLKGVAEGFTVQSEMVTIRDSEPDAIVLTIGLNDLRSELELAEDVNARFADLPGGSESPLTLKVRAAFPASIADGDLPNTDTVINLGGADGKLRERFGAVSSAAGTGDYAVQSVVLGTRDTPLTLTIPANMRSAEGTIRVSLADDQIAEENENLQIVGITPNHQVSPAVIYITDDDVLPSYDLSVSPQLVAEGATGVQWVTVTARAKGSAGLGRDTVIQLALNGTEVGGPDFEPVAEEDLRLTVPADAASGSLRIGLVMVDDNVAEGVTAVWDAAQLSGSATSPIGGEELTITAAGQQSQLVILDNDVAPNRIALSVPSGGVREGPGTRSVTVRAAFPEGSPVRPVDTKVSVRIGGAVHNVDAEAGRGDYTAPSSVLVTIPAGKMSGSATFDITLIDDQLSEEPENVTLTGRAVAPYEKPYPAFPDKEFIVSHAVFAITDNDETPAFVALQVAPAEPAAGGASGTSEGPRAGLFTGIVREGQAVTEYTVTATFGPGAARAQDTVLTFGLGGRQAASTALTLPDGRPVIGLDGNPVTITTPADTAVKGTDFQIVDEDGDPVTDDLTVTIPAGQTSGSAAFRLEVTDDTVANEELEKLTVYSTAPDDARPRFAIAPVTISIMDNDRVSEINLTLLDENDEPLEQVRENVGAAVPVKVKASYPGTAVLGADTALDVYIFAGTAEGKLVPADGKWDGTNGSEGDFADSAETENNPVRVTIAAGDNSAIVSLTNLSFNDDEVAETDEYLSLQGTVAGMQTVDFTVNDHQLAVLDDDIPVTLAVDADTGTGGIQTDVAEADGIIEVEVTATLPAKPPTAFGGTITLAFTETSDANKADEGGGAGDDFQLVDENGDPLPGVDLTFDDGERTSDTVTLRLKVADDRTVEPNETLATSGTSDRFSNITAVTVTIVDDDVDLTVDNPSVDERTATNTVATTMTVTATVGVAAPVGGRTVALEVKDDGTYTIEPADYGATPSASPFQVQIAAGDTTGTASFELTTVDDDEAEDHETLGVVGTLSGFQVDPAVITIMDQDRGITLTFTDSSNNALPELSEVDGSSNAQAVRVHATLDASSSSLTANTSVAVTVGASGGTATLGSTGDFTRTPASVTAVIPAGQLTVAASSDTTITTYADNIAEGRETVRFTATSSGFTIPAADLEIADPDSKIVLVLSSTEVAENDNATFTVTAKYGTSVTSSTISGATAVAVTVATASTLGADRDDYSYTDTTVSIPAQAITSGAQSLALSITDDDRVDAGAGGEKNEEGLVIDGNPPAGFPDIDPVSLSIVDDDHIVSWTLTQSESPYTGGDEGDSLGTVRAQANFAGNASDLTSAVTVTLNIRTDGDATAEAADLTSPGSPITFTIQPGEVSSNTANLTGYAFTQDTAAELPETVLAGGTVTNSYKFDETTLTITDDDSRITLTLTGAAEEADGNAGDASVVAAFASTAVTSEITDPTVITLAFGTGDGATAEAADFTAPGTAITLTIAGGSVSPSSSVALTNVGITADTRAEGTETINVTTSVTGGLEKPGFKLPITDDSDLDVTLIADTDNDESGDQKGLAEDVSPVVRVRARFTTATINDLSEPLVVQVTASELSTASALGSGTDFRAPVTPVNVTIPTGAASLTGSATVFTGFVLNDDRIAEAPETFLISGTNTGAATGGTVTPDTLTINDDDTAIRLTTNPAAVQEATAAHDVTVTAAFDATSSVLSSATTVTVQIASGDGTDGATLGSAGPPTTGDFDTDQTNDRFTISIPAGDVSNTGTFKLTAWDDNLNEGIERAKLTGSATVSGVSRQTESTMDILDGGVVVTLRDTGGNLLTSLAENSGTTQVRVHVTLPAAPTSALVVGLNVVGGTAVLDTGGAPFAATEDFRVSFPAKPLGTPSGYDLGVRVAAGQTTGSATVTLAVNNDRVAEGGEDETILFRGGQVTINSESLPVLDRTLGIADDDSAITLSISGTAEESDGNAGDARVTARFAGTSSVIAAATVVSLTYSVAPTQATADAADFTAPGTAITVTIPAGSTSSSAVALTNLTITDDAAAEETERVQVGGTASGLDVTGVFLSIADDDAQVTLSVPSNASVSEGGNGSGVMVSAAFKTGTTSSQITSDLVITLTATDGTATASSGDFRYAPSPPNRVTIPAGTTSSTTAATLAGLTINHDAISEGEETLSVGGTSRLGAATAASLPVTDADGDIELSLSPGTVVERAAAHTITVTARYTGDGRVARSTRTSSTAVAVTVAGGDGSDAASMGSGSADDFTANPTSLTITIPAGSVSHTGTFQVTAPMDGRDEGTEKAKVSGTATVDGSSRSASTELSITDRAILNLSVLDADVTASGTQTVISEGAGSVRMRIRAAIPSDAVLPAGGVTVNLTVTTHYVASGGEAVTAAGTINIPSGSRTGTTDITVNVRDDNVFGEGGGTWTISGTATDMAVVDATVTVQDDDRAPTRIQLTVDPASGVFENVGSSAQTIGVKANFPAGSAVLTTATTVTLNVGGTGTSATAGTDFDSLTVPSPFTVTIPARSRESTTAGTFTVVIRDDTEREAIERIAVAGSAGGFTVDSTSLRIVDDDAVPELSIGNQTVSENVGTVTVSVRLTGLPASGFVARASTADGSAHAGVDFRAVTDRALTFVGTDGETQTFTVSIINDRRVEGDESFGIRVTVPEASGVTVDSRGGTIIITDNDTVSPTTGTRVTTPPPTAPSGPPTAPTTPPPGPTAPTGPPAPTGPTEPTDPTAPTEPTGPTEPTEPTEPETWEGTFRDDEGSVHEPAIEQIAEEGITRGCDDRGNFCPNQSITRRQMSAFLYRAVIEGTGAPAPPPSGIEFTDVPAGAWYSAYADWVTSIGAFSAPGGMFNPGGVVTRADMAVMLVAAFSHLQVVEEVEGLFTDVSGLSNNVLRAIEGLYHAEITLGCDTDPLRYCPNEPVTRAQMASFFVRAENTAPS